MSPLADRIAHAILAELLNRKGFEAWWEEIDPDIQVEIKVELAQVTENVIRSGILREG